MKEILRIIFYGFTKKYFAFNGRAGRKEFAVLSVIFLAAYVPFVYVPLVVSGLMELRASIIFLISFFLFLLLLIPGMAVSVRRLHDLGYSGWWYLLWCTTAASVYGGVIVLNVIFCFLESAPGTNKYGEPPN